MAGLGSCRSLALEDYLPTLSGQGTLSVPEPTTATSQLSDAVGAHLLGRCERTHPPPGCLAATEYHTADSVPRKGPRRHIEPTLPLGYEVLAKVNFYYCLRPADAYGNKQQFIWQPPCHLPIDSYQVLPSGGHVGPRTFRDPSPSPHSLTTAGVAATSVHLAALHQYGVVRTITQIQT